MKHSMYDHRQNVLELQTYLRANHLLEGGPLINPDGLFDSTTTEAVRLFQRQNGLAVTGIVDYVTWLWLVENSRQLCNESHCLLRRIDRRARR